MRGIGSLVLSSTCGLLALAVAPIVHSQEAVDAGAAPDGGGPPAPSDAAPPGTSDPAPAATPLALPTPATSPVPIRQPPLSPPPPPPGWRPPPFVPQVYYGDESSDDDEGGRRRYYGWQTFTVVGISASFFAASIVLLGENEEGAGSLLLGVAIGGYALGPPIVHWAHGNVGKGFASLGMHLFIPPATTFVGALAGCSGNDFAGCIVGTIVGWQIGILVPPLIDGTVLAWEDDDTPERDGATGPSLRLVPLTTTKQLGAGVGGRF